MFTAAWTADQSSERWAGALALSIVTVGARAHFFVAPSDPGFGGGGINP